MRYIYTVVENRKESSATIDLPAYGVSCKSEEKLIFEISDLTEEEELAEELAKLCTQEQVEPIHFFCVWGDLLAQKAMEKAG